MRIIDKLKTYLKIQSELMREFGHADKEEKAEVVDRTRSKWSCDGDCRARVGDTECVIAHGPYYGETYTCFAVHKQDLSHHVYVVANKNKLEWK